MKPAPFVHHAPGTIAEALSLLAGHFQIRNRGTLGGGAARRAARARVARIAAHLLEAAPEDIVVEGGAASVAGTPTFMDYPLPTAAEVPRITVGHVETPSPAPGGHKGMGEGGATGSPAAVFNAVADALVPLGARLCRTPLSPAAVLAAIEAAAG